MMSEDSFRALSRSAGKRNVNMVNSVRKKLARYVLDQDVKTRISDKGLCKYCYYIETSRVGGSAMTTIHCPLCAEAMHFNSTSVDFVCKNCSATRYVCRRCGQKMD